MSVEKQNKFTHLVTTYNFTVTCKFCFAFSYASHQVVCLYVYFHVFFPLQPMKITCPLSAPVVPADLVPQFMVCMQCHILFIYLLFIYFLVLTGFPLYILHGYASNYSVY